MRRAGRPGAPGGNRCGTAVSGGAGRGRGPRGRRGAVPAHGGRGGAGGAFPGYAVYDCADGYIALGAVEPHFFLGALATFGTDGTHEAFRKAFADKTIAELEAIAAREDLPLNGIRRNNGE